MPDPDRLLRTLRQAVVAFRATPGRRGRLVELPAGAEVLVGGDLHGNVENFRLLLQRAELATQPQRHLILQEVVHGQFFYANGGDKSHQLLDLLAALKCQYPRQVHVLLGNHELAQWTGQRIGKGDRNQNEEFRLGVEAAYGDRAAEVCAAYEGLFEAMALAVRTAVRVFVSHSLPPARHMAAFDPAALERDATEPADWRLGGSLHSVVWGRDVSLANVTEYLRKVDADLLVSGHIPADEGFHVPHERQIILDSLGTPACYLLFPTDRPLTHAELVGRIGTL